MAGRVSGSRSGGSRERRVGKGAWAPLQRLWGLLPQVWYGGSHYHCFWGGGWGGGKKGQWWVSGSCSASSAVSSVKGRQSEQRRQHYRQVRLWGSVHCHWCASGGVFIATGAPLGECSLPLVRLWGSVHCHWCASGGVFIATGAPLGECSLPLVRLWGSVHCHWCASGGVFIATGAPLGECSLPLVRLWGSVHCHWCASGGVFIATGAPLGECSLPLVRLWGSVHCHWCASGGVFIATGAPLGECSLPLVRLWGSVHCHWCASGGVFIATGAPLGECSLPLVRLWGSVHCHWCASGGVVIATGAPLGATPTVIAARAATASNGMGCRGKGGKWRERESAGGREGKRGKEDLEWKYRIVTGVPWLDVSPHRPATTHFPPSPLSPRTLTATSDCAARPRSLPRIGAARFPSSRRSDGWSPPIVLEAARVRSSPISTTNSTSHRLTSAAASSSSSASSGWDLRRQEKREKRGKRGKRPAVRRRSKEGWRESERDDLTGVNENGHDCSQNRSDDRSRRRILLQRRTRGGGRMEPAEGGRGMPAADSGGSDAAASVANAAAAASEVVGAEAATTAAAAAEGTVAAGGTSAAAGAAAGAGGAAAGGKRKGKKSGRERKGGREAATMEVEEREAWARGLPVVQERVPYSQVVALKKSNELKHIIKHPQSSLQSEPERVFLVLKDDRVVRCMLPPLDRDPSFWAAWKDLSLDSLTINAFSPPPAPPVMQPWGLWGPSLKFLQDWGWVGGGEGRREGVGGKGKGGAEGAGESAGKGKGKPLTAKQKAEAAMKERVRRLAEERKETERRRVEKERELKRQREERIRMEREERRRAEREEREQQKQEEQEQRGGGAKAKKRGAEEKNVEARRKKLVAQVASQERWGSFYKQAANNEGVRFLIGAAFFVFFYFGIIVNVKKKRKDYEDRIKLERAAEEERRKMEGWEEDMEEMEAREEEEAEKEKEREKKGGKKAGVVVAKGKDGKEAEDGKGEGKGEGEGEGKVEEEKNQAILAGMRFMRSGAKVRRARKGKRTRRPTYLDLSAEVKFSDVAGLGEIRRELEEVVEFFQSAEKYRRRGSKIPSGILLCGEPGSGKTLLAKAVAGEAGVSFFSVSASQFVEIFVGVGASRVRALYNEARENAPSVVFIDELDAVGRQRGLTEGSGGQERDATLNQGHVRACRVMCGHAGSCVGMQEPVKAHSPTQVVSLHYSHSPALSNLLPSLPPQQLLTCLDGFEGRGDVITIAATNRPDILDAALVRPGRFDRKIYIPKPSLKGRAQILEVHSRNKVLDDDVDFEAVAQVTDGMSGAELANVVDVAALRVLRENRSEWLCVCGGWLCVCGGWLCVVGGIQDNKLQAAILNGGGYLWLHHSPNDPIHAPLSPAPPPLRLPSPPPSLTPPSPIKSQQTACCSAVHPSPALTISPHPFPSTFSLPPPHQFTTDKMLQAAMLEEITTDDVLQMAMLEEGGVLAPSSAPLSIAIAPFLVHPSSITTDDMLQAAMLEEGGYPSPHEGSPIRQRQLALNEAALAVVAFNFRDFQNIQLITVVPRMTEEKGSVRYKLVDTQKMKANFISASCLRDFITVQLAPMVADEMWNGAEETCTIWADHADVARRTVRQVALNGLSAPSEEGALYGIGVAAVDAPWRREAVDADASRILEECRTRAAQILRRNRSLVDALVDKLIEEKAMGGEEFASLARQYGSFDTPPPSPVEMRDRQLARFREAMMAGEKERAARVLLADPVAVE
ncbi:unnamed protein product [Closterium sp. NIES-65]|nr:unnamed protein product [Closterium sp. NIES-65]